MLVSVVNAPIFQLLIPFAYPKSQEDQIRPSFINDVFLFVVFHKYVPASVGPIVPVGGGNQMGTLLPALIKQTVM